MPLIASTTFVFVWCIIIIPVALIIMAGLIGKDD